MEKADKEEFLFMCAPDRKRGTPDVIIHDNFKTFKATVVKSSCYYRESNKTSSCLYHPGGVGSMNGWFVR